MILEKLIVGPMQVNCYILGSTSIKEAIIIDPGAEPEKIKRTLQKHCLKPAFIINTHGHIDHIGANALLSLPIYIHEADALFLKDPEKNLSDMLGVPFISPEADKLLRDGNNISLGEISLEAIHTPGHTPGGICLCTDNLCFTGDTLFAGGVGRTDFPYGSEKDLLGSIRTKLMALKDEVIIYPGHGPCSTIGEERINNAFL
ncbi:MAG: MBL fold metallo-hydrolase [Candidatus Omnitrophica bacterium]|nr:MBL fold metallo-hydrolase [Candidatus Omnitrophota bacterium]